MEQNNDPRLPNELTSGLDEISHILEQMLGLAELSASDLNLNRDALQKTLERLRDRIDQIADCIGMDWNKL